MVGVDEVGRGCWAGPLLVVAARAKSELPAGLKDSKLLAKVQRQSFYTLLINVCDFGEGWVTPTEIDKFGLAKALRIGVARALKNLKTELNEQIIMDGKANYLPKKFKNAKSMVDADNLVPIVSASSIYAKVSRDKFMTGLALKHPAYGFEKHVGYGTKAHRLAIEALGTLESVHRMSFAPLKMLGRVEV